jgi:hypothetical protein
MRSADEEDNASTKSPQLPVVRLPNPQSTLTQENPEIDSLLQTLELIQKRIMTLQVQVEKKLDNFDPPYEHRNIKVSNNQQPQSRRRGRRPQRVIQLQVDRVIYVSILPLITNLTECNPSARSAPSAD